jgi:cyclohexanone monooxygenase
MALHFDFLIIGAGISGLGAACHLRRHFADSSLAILEAMDGFGGTWWTHRYPGARSDSDLYTYGYDFKPWRGRSIATADEIRAYLAEVIEENGLAPRIRYGHKVTSARWSSQESHWTVQATNTGTGESLTVTAGFLWMCAGYYDHDRGYTPEWPGMSNFQGRIVHPQHWPQDLDYTGKRVVVIGSGATAATLIPNMAETAGHVTMLQRSPTFFASEPREHPLEAQLRPLQLPDAWMHEIMRRAHIAKTGAVVQAAYEHPEELRAYLIEQTRAHLPEGYDVGKHFNPRYKPWQQRIAVVPDGDLFAAIRTGRASVVTDTIECFDATGICLTSGEHLDADIVVTATGFNMQLMGGVPFSIDSKPVDFSKHVTWRGVMVQGVPNLAYTQGYFRWSWTLRADLVSDLVCRVIAHMRAEGHSVVEPTLRAQDADMPRHPWTDPDNINAGYMLRAQDRLLRQGDRAPWQQLMEYAEERVVLPAVEPLEEALSYR